MYLFPATSEGEEQALLFAENVELKFVEDYIDSDGNLYYYYKAHGNSWLKERFDSKVELYEALVKNAEENVNVIYHNATEEYAIKPLDEAIQSIETTNLEKDVKVCADEETRRALLVSDVLINGFQFFKAAPYESARIEAVDEFGNIINIPYDTPIETILTNTGTYTFREYNWNGCVEYIANFIADGDNTGVLALTYTKDFVQYDETLSQSTTGSSFDANSVTLTSGSDLYDSQTLLTIVSLGKRSTMLLSEVDGYTITAPGSYQIILTNRLGHTITMHFTLEEAPKVDLIFEGYDEYNKQIEFGGELGELPTPQQYGYDFIGWTTLNGDLPVTSDTLCESKDEVRLYPVFEPKKATVILNYLNGYKKLEVDFNSLLELPQYVNGVEGYFEFAHWKFEDEIVERVEVQSLDTLILIAEYYFIADIEEIDPDVAYSGDEVISLMSYISSNPPKQEPVGPVLDDFIAPEIDHPQADDKDIPNTENNLLEKLDKELQNSHETDIEENQSNWWYKLLIIIGAALIILFAVIILIICVFDC